MVYPLRDHFYFSVGRKRLIFDFDRPLPDVNFEVDPQVERLFNLDDMASEPPTPSDKDQPVMNEMETLYHHFRIEESEFRGYEKDQNNRFRKQKLQEIEKRSNLVGHFRA